MTADVTGRVLCDWIENDPNARSGGRICYNARKAGVEVDGWVKYGKRGKLDFCPDHAEEAMWGKSEKSGKSWRQ